MTEDELRSFLLTRVAALLEIKPSDIDPDEDLSSYGLSSVHAVNLAGELEDALQRRDLDPSLLFEHSSINAVARYLSA